MSERVAAIFADRNGELHEESELVAVGVNGRQVEVADETWIDLPPGGELVLMPGRWPMGYARETGEIEVIEEFEGTEVTAVAAIIPVGLSRTLTPGYEISNEQELPLFGYTAVGAAEGRLKVAAIKTDEDLKWNPVYYNTNDLPRLIKEKKQEFTQNRILEQLSRCAMEYHCLTAQNIFYRRWEAGIPVSPQCNANCLGCISKQPAECCPSPQNRIEFVPTETEVVELAVAHLEQAPDGIISFGQGCEGEPSLQYQVLRGAIREIRKQTSRGTININTNAGNYQAIREIVAAGLDSIRVSLFSAVPQNYNWYHRPHGYELADLRQSLRFCAENGLQVAVNLLFFPGINNQARETESLIELMAETGVNQIQLRNLNLDPELVRGLFSAEELPSVSEWLLNMKEQLPRVSFGNYTRPKK